MSGIDGRNLPPSNPAMVPANNSSAPSNSASAATVVAGDDGEAFNPFADPGTTGKHAKGATKGPAAAGAGAPQAAGAAAASMAATDVQGMPADFDQDSGVIGEKKRTGMAALSEPPPMPPSALRMTPEHLKNFTTLNSDMHEALSRGAATNQPNFQQMSTKLAATDTSTPQGQAQAQQLQGRMQQVATTHVASLAGASGLGAFLMLAVGYQDKQKSTMGSLNNLTMQGREQMGKIQVAQQHEQARAMEKAQKKQEALAFLKPLLAVVMAAFSVLTMGTGTGLALAGVGAMAGFVGGGVVGGKGNGGFDVGKAFEGAAMGLGAGGLGGMLTKMSTMVAEMAAKVGIKVGATEAGQVGAKAGGSSVTRLFSDMAKKAGIQEAAQGSKALQGLKALNQKTGSLFGKSADEAGVKATAQLAKSESGAAAPQGIVNQSKGYLKSKIDGLMKQPVDARLQTAANIGQFATDAVATTGQFLTDNQRAKASVFEARAKMTKVIEKALEQEGDRTQESIQSLIDHRKQTFDTIASMENSSQQTASKIASNMAR